MTPKRWQQVEQLYLAALERATDQRAQFLNQACDGDDELRSEVETLLAQESAAENLMATPVMEVAAKLFAADEPASLVGQTLGSYKIQARLGAGGMGEVFQAQDTRLDRTVALKILPLEVAHDKERLQRFVREAKAASALNHPHVATIYDIGEAENLHFIAMEYIEGQTLAAKINGTPLAINEVIAIGCQIADALDEAHSKGITHRDIKPANVMLTSRGQVKVLDFGLAKLTRPPSIESDISTLAKTQSGVVMGTPQYMSPEQVRGQKVDHRSDIFSFGVLLYEMLSGKRPFQGDSIAETMAAIAREKPPALSEINSEVPGQFEMIVKRCLEKRPEQRFQSASDLRFALEALTTSATPLKTNQMAVSTSRRSVISKARIIWGLTAIASLGLLAVIPFIVYFLRQGKLADPQPINFSISIPDKTSLLSLSISPDGRRLAMNVKDTTGNTLIYFRPLESEQSQKLAGTDGALYPFWSPDSRWIGFTAKGKLKKIEASGGPTQGLCAAPDLRGGTWNQDGVILFSPGGGPLFRVVASGGEPVMVTNLDESRGERSHRWPQFLPDGRNFLYLIESANPENHGVYIGSLDGSVKKQLLRVETNAVYATPGYLFFAQESKLMAQAFDVQKIMLVGEPFPLNDLFTPASAQQQAELLEINIEAAQMSLSNSESGVIAYSQRNHNRALLTWVDRQGKRLGAIEGDYRRPDISLDGKKIAFEGNAPQKPDGDVWMMDVNRGIPVQLTSHPGFDFSAIWAPDSNRVVFSSNRGPVWDFFIKTANGTDNAELLYSSKTNKAPDNWSADGRFLAFDSFGGMNGIDIWILPMEGERKAFPLIQTEFNELEARFSPNGKWIAYNSDKSGSPQIYIRNFPENTEEKQISAEGGAFPRWRHDGRELFFISADARLMSVDVKTDSQFEAGVPKPLFEINPPGISGPWDGSFAVTPDGQRFLIRMMEGKSTPTPVTILANWATKLRKN